MTISFSNTISTEDYCFLRNSVGFSVVSENQARTAIEKSDFIITANVNNITVGMVRLITDGLQALIMDLAVHPDYQRKGIGKCLMIKIKEYLQSIVKNDDKILINLITDSSKLKFYERLGFNKAEGMRLRIGNK